MSNHARKGRRRSTRRSSPSGPRVASCTCPICQGQSHDDYLDRILAIVDEAGFAIQSVLGDQAPMLTWSYSIGLGASLGVPELVVTGCSQSDAQWLIHRVHDQLLAGAGCATGRDVRHRISCGDHTHDVCLVDVDPVLVARSSLLANGHNLSAVLGPVDRAVQIVWEDERARMPWEAGAPHGIDQDLLDRPTAAVRRALAEGS